jgi:hypothetical protein
MLPGLVSLCFVLFCWMSRRLKEAHLWNLICFLKKFFCPIFSKKNIYFILWFYLLTSLLVELQLPCPIISAMTLCRMVSCKIFEHFALQVGSSNWVHKLGCTPFKDGTTLAPKLADPLSFWRSSSTPSKYRIKYFWSGMTHILYYKNMSVRCNRALRNQIWLCQQVFYYNGIQHNNSHQ